MSVLMLWWSKVLQILIYSLDVIKVYAMKVVVSTLFRAMHFPHDGKIMTIDHLSFVTPNHRITPSSQTTLNLLHVLVVPSPSYS